MLQSFADKITERVGPREQVRAFDSELLRSAVRRVLILDAAEELRDLTVSRGNRLEKVRGDRAGQHSIRINQQWRICFRWTAGPEDVTIVGYHRGEIMTKTLTDPINPGEVLKEEFLTRTTTSMALEKIFGHARRGRGLVHPKGPDTQDGHRD